jgi:hypothetical protein
MQDDLKYNGRFQQPWYRRPKLGQCTAQWMSGRVRHCVGTVFFEPGARFFICEACWGMIMSRLYDRLA